jgi:hypothetical protein
MATQRFNASPSARLCVVALILAGSSGCSLIRPTMRPLPDADRNLICMIEYRPDPSHEGPDILFTAVASPYRLEGAHMNPLEVLLHTVVGPGRHLSGPVEILGAECESPWQAGHRMPMSVSRRHYFLCRRLAASEVRIATQTKWGMCEQVIPRDDTRPRCRRWGSRPIIGLQYMSQTACLLESHPKKR